MTEVHQFSDSDNGISVSVYDDNDHYVLIGIDTDADMTYCVERYHKEGWLLSAVCNIAIKHVLA